MSGIYLPRLFPPHIAERGLLYFQQGKVRDVQKTSAGRYRAEVCGSENYSVWLKLDSDLYIKDGGCDCPYGWACKHMAALWYVVRAQTPDGLPDETDAMIFAARRFPNWQVLVSRRFLRKNSIFSPRFLNT